ncbi:unnamed protein product, partial [Mesorhabditis belari]|uniref:Exosome complex component RRP4 n=1 Tax=Mesorhabditis belari TaxID=2138241 RepID=A0AAF3EQV9_9BILA
MRGHGTYLRGDELYSSLAGAVRQVNRLINVQSVKQRYSPEIGDVVVGSITEVQEKRWKVDICGRLDAHLQLASVNLPGGELRRKTTRRRIGYAGLSCRRQFISAEVQQVPRWIDIFAQRSLKYGKLALSCGSSSFPT